MEVTSGSCAKVRVAMTAHGTTGPSAVRLSRERLAGHRVRLHDGRNRTKALIDRVDAEDGAFVVKDVATCPFWVRAFLGPWQLRREARAYERLAGVEGVPRLVGVVDHQAIALQFIDGRPLKSLPRGSIDPAFFDRLEALVRAVHGRGVAHGDLHHGDVLVAADGRPYLVDFSTSWVGGAGSAWPARTIFEQMCRADLRSIAKLRCRYATGGAPPPPPRPWLYRVAAGLRDLVRRGPGTQERRAGPRPRGGAARAPAARLYTSRRVC
jgi:serine/threonine protein kinase